MSEFPPRLTDEIMLVLEINRAKFDTLEFGEIVFRVHKGRLKEFGASETLRIDAGVQLSPVPLKNTHDEG